MSDPSSDRRPSGRPGPGWSVAAVAVFGLLATIAATVALHTANERALEIEFRQRADERFRVLEHALDDVVNGVRSFSTSLEVLGEPSRVEFERLASGLLVDAPSIEALGFNRLVRAEDRAAFEAVVRATGRAGFTITERDAQGALVPAAVREQYVVVSFIAPLEGNETAVGFDVASEPVRRLAFERASATGSVAVTGRLTLVQETEGDVGLLIADPVFVDAGRQRRIVGYGVGVVRLGQLVAHALDDLQPAGVGLRLVDLDAPGDHRELFTYRSRLASAGSDRRSTRLEPTASELVVAGRRWSVEATPIAVWDERGGIGPWVTLAVGLLSTLAIAGYLHRQTVIGHRLQRAIEQRDHAEQRLAGFGRMLDESQEEIYVIDAATLRFVHVNRGACRNLGYTMDELREMGPLDLVPEADRSLVRRALDDVDREPVESVHRRKDGSRYAVEAHLDRSTFDDRPALVAMVLDVTERRRVEDRLRQSQRIEALGTLAGGIAHDINNLLTSIMGYADLASSDAPAGSRQRHHLHEVIRASELVRDVVRRILTFSRQGESRREPVELRALLDETVRLVRTSLPANVDVRRRFPDAACHVQGDPTQLRQLLMNLLTNAGHAMREDGGRLTVALEAASVSEEALDGTAGLEPGPHARIEVRDTGCGIAPEIVERIFDPFFTTKGPGEGTGMGLSVAHGIVASHRGAITVTSRPGRGTTFEVWLPTTASRRLPEASGERAAAPVGPARIVLVDDEPAVLAVTGELLRSAGFDVETFGSGPEAFDHVALDPSRVDLVVTDYRMPLMTGTELAERLEAVAPRLPVVLVSGYGELLEARGSVRAGVRRVLAKPLRADELTEAVRAALRDEPASDRRAG